MIFWAFIAGIAAAVVGAVYFFRNRAKVRSAAARAVTVPGSVTNSIAKLSPEAAEALKAADASLVDKAKSL